MPVEKLCIVGADDETVDRSIATGAVVMLKCGGYPMVVREVSRGGKRPKAACDWHHDDGAPICAEYYLDQLSLARRLVVQDEDEA